MLAGLLLALLAVRVAAVQGLPARAAAIWPGHPTVALDAGLRAIGQSVAAGHPPPAEVTAAVRGVARRDPLNPGPLLVEGTNAFAAGETRRAEQLLLAASRLDPLAPAPRFLLAQLYFRENRGDAGLAQVGFLFERLDGNAAPLIPALAQYAAQPGAAARLKPLLDRQPQTRGLVLSLLAEQPANLPAILALAPKTGGADDAEWRQRLLTALVADRQYARAYALWRGFAHVPAPATASLFNPRFAAGGPPPPFNWRLESGSAGTAEPQPGGGLHLLYFGRDDTVLADQTMLLAPGRYRLGFQVKGPATGLSWALTCLPGTAAQAQELARGAFDFTVPASGCAAQRLELKGTPGDYPMTVDTVVSPVALSRGAAA